MQYTDEQNAIIGAITKQKQDVICNAVAGSGKTTVILATAQELYRTTSKKTLIVTYSSRLKTDTKSKTKDLPYIIVESFHSLLYTPDFPVSNDQHMVSFFQCGYDATWDKYPLIDYTMVAFDESQDMSPMYRKVAAFVRDRLSPACRVLYVGDFFQAIYTDMHGIRPDDFLSQDGNDRHFEIYRLTKSHRFTPEIAALINYYLNPIYLLKTHYPERYDQVGTTVAKLWGQGVTSSRPAGGPAVQIVPLDDLYQARTDPAVVNFMQQAKNPESLVILVGSTGNGKSPGGTFVQTFTTRNNFFVIESGSQKSASMADRDTELHRHKVTMCTVFAAKGMEWDRVLHIGLTAYWERKNPLAMIFQAYTCWTRTRNHLMVCVDNKHRWFRDRDRTRLPPRVKPKTGYGVRDLLAYVPPQDNLQAMVVAKVVNEELDFPDITSLFYFNRNDLGTRTMEDVSRFTGLVVEKAIGKYLQSGDVCCLTREEWIGYYQEVVNNMSMVHLKNQISSYDFVEPDVLAHYVDNTVKILRRHIGIITGVVSQCQLTKNCYRKTIHGVADFIIDTITDRKYVVELKTANRLGDDDVHQLACYGAMVDQPVTMLLINSRTGEMREIVTSSSEFLPACVYRKIMTEADGPPIKRKHVTTGGENKKIKI